MFGCQYYGCHTQQSACRVRLNVTLGSNDRAFATELTDSAETQVCDPTKCGRIVMPRQHHEMYKQLHAPEDLTCNLTLHTKVGKH